MLVCLGNPPYRRWPVEDADADIRYGGWVRHGDEAQQGAEKEPALLNSFIHPVQAAGNGLHLHNLYNDYVAFWRWAIWKVFENKSDGEHSIERPGLVSFITASSYLRGPAFAGMREAMRHTFNHLWIIDLGGSERGAVISKNVFAITTPVCIAIGLRVKENDGASSAQVKYHRVDGSREEKLRFLDNLNSMTDIPWEDCPEDWQAPLMPRKGERYWSWPAITELFPIQKNGVKAGRTWPIGETKALLEARWRALLQSAPEEREALFKSSPSGRKVEAEKSRLKTSLPPAASKEAPLSLKPGAPQPELVRYGFRSFDRMWLMADHRLLDRPSPDLWRAHGPKQVYMISFLTEPMGEGAAATVSSHIPDIHSFRGSYGGQHVIPLYLDQNAKLPNIHSEILGILGEHFGFSVTAEELFSYTYAILANPGYEKRFRESLTIPGPRLPITRNGSLFKEVADIGSVLIHIHTYGERFGDDVISEGSAEITKDIPGDEKNYPIDFKYTPDTQTTHVGSGEISGVSEDVWNFHISGLYIVQSWLGYRMKEGDGKKSGELSRIRIKEWTPNLNDELLELLSVVESTIELYPRLDLLLEQVVDGETIDSGDIPTEEQKFSIPVVADSPQPSLLDLQ